MFLSLRERLRVLRGDILVSPWVPVKAIQEKNRGDAEVAVGVEDSEDKVNPEG